MKIGWTTGVRRIAGAWMLLAVGVPGALSQSDAKAKEGKLRGKVILSVPGVSLADISPLVVFLDAKEGALKFEVPKDVPTVSQKDAKFSPPFVVIAAGQTVAMPNDDRIVHNVFSYSKAKAFDLGLYPKGEQKTVQFPNPGVVDLYCSIHVNMNATIYVAPSPYFAQPDATGSFEIKGVPAGKYRLKTWNRKLGESTMDVEVAEGADKEVQVQIRGKE